MRTLVIAAALGLASLTALPAAAQVNGREAEQQHRIDQGVRSGELTPREAAHDERQQGRIDSSVARMRARNGGYLTRYQRERINARQNRASRHIYRTKHNYRGYCVAAAPGPRRRAVGAARAGDSAYRRAGAHAPALSAWGGQAPKAQGATLSRDSATVTASPSSATRSPLASQVRSPPRPGKAWWKRSRGRPSLSA